MSFHDGTDIGEVQVDHCRNRNQIRNGLNRLTQNVVCLLEGILKRNMTDDFKDLIVGDDDQRIAVLLEILKTLLRLNHTLAALKGERLRNDSDCKSTKLLGNLCKQRRSTGTSTAAKTRCQEDHVRAFHCLADIRFTFNGSFAPVVRIAAGTQTGLAELNLVLHRRHIKRLYICIRNVELYALNAILNHPVNRISACAADTEHLDFGDLIIA